MFSNFSREERRQGGSMAEVLMERLVSSMDRVPDEAIPSIAEALAETMDRDELAVAGDFNERFAWHSATRLLGSMLKKAQPTTRNITLSRLFGEGKASGWLTSIFRGEIFSHGLFGDQRRPESDWILTQKEFNDVIHIMNERYHQLPREKLMNVPDFLNVLFAWAQSGHAKEAKAWVTAQIETTVGLLAFLQRTKSWSNQNGTTYYPLRRRNLDRFLDFDQTLRRLEEISQNGGFDEHDRETAKELLASVVDRDDLSLRLLQRWPISSGVRRGPRAAADKSL